MRRSQVKESEESELKVPAAEVVGVDVAFFAFFVGGSSIPESLLDSELFVKGDKGRPRLESCCCACTREGTLAAVVEVAAECGVGIVAATAGVRGSLISKAIRRTHC